MEHRGFFQLCDLLTKEEYALLQRRLGYHNIYDPFSSIHYFELNLAHPEHREIVVHIVRLAVLEPGDNVMDAWFCGLRFEIPAGWCQRLPKEGVLTLFYCREQATIDQLVAGEHPECVPSNFKSFQPADTEWCIEEKKFQIKAKLQAVFPSAEVCFQVSKGRGASCLHQPQHCMHRRSTQTGVGRWTAAKSAEGCATTAFGCFRTSSLRFWIGLTRTAEAALRLMNWRNFGMK